MPLIRILLIGLVAFITVSVFAFIYLIWWQAILLTIAAFVLMNLVVKRLAMRSLKGMMQFATDLVQIKSQVLRGAKIEVHSIQSVFPPAHEIEAVANPDPDEGLSKEEIAEDVAWVRDLNWLEIDATIIPDSNAKGAMEHWDLFDLVLVPANAKAVDLFAMAGNDAPSEDVYFSEVRLVENGQAIEVEEGKFLGPKRIRFIAGFPPELQEVKFRYYVEQFGLIQLPSTTPAIRQ